MDDEAMERQIDAHLDTLLSNAPQVPPALGIGRNKTTEEMLAELNSSPLFMTDLEQNDDVAALQALAYEGTALENAEGFKERGNESFREKRPADAKQFYTKAAKLLLLADKEGKPEEQHEAEARAALLESVYVNRAACHLDLGNYRSCWTDCASALRLNPRNIKAYYRAARALLKVDRADEAKDTCERGLAVEPGNKALLRVSEEITHRAEFLNEKKRLETVRRETQTRRAAALRDTLLHRGVSMVKMSKDGPPDMDGAKVALVDPDEDEVEKREIVFPTILLYPLRMETDFVKAFSEVHCLHDHLEYILPPPWDANGEYALGKVACYVETKSRSGKLIKMGKRVTLRALLAGGKVDVVDQVVRIFVVPADKADAWIQDFKAQAARTT